MTAQLMCDLEFGAHAICSGDQHRLLKACKIELEQPSKATDSTQDFRAQCFVNERLEPRHAVIGGGKAHSGGTVGITHEVGVG